MLLEDLDTIKITVFRMLLEGLDITGITLNVSDVARSLSYIELTF